MSAIAALYNVPSTAEEMATWATAHAQHHRDIIRVIYQLTNISLGQYLLDPFNPNDAELWTYQHQQMHQDMDFLLGIAGYDLLDVDLTNQKELAGWVFLNASEHYAAAATLGIG